MFKEPSRPRSREDAYRWSVNERLKRAGKTTRAELDHLDAKSARRRSLELKIIVARLEDLYAVRIEQAHKVAKRGRG